MSNPQHEPTMEEILASIRKIISEDSNEEEAPAPAPVNTASAPAPEAHEEADDVLELTEEIPEEPVTAPEPEEPEEIVFQAVEEEPAPPPAPEPVPVAEPAPVEEPEPEPVVMQAPTEEPPPELAAPSTSAGEGIFSEKTRKALDDAFANIEPEEDEGEPARAEVTPGLEGQTVAAIFDRAVRESFDPVLRKWLGDESEAIVERMKPVIRDWMDQHFPPMLEEAVRNEVARVAKARRR